MFRKVPIITALDVIYCQLTGNAEHFEWRSG